MLDADRQIYPADRLKTLIRVCQVGIRHTAENAGAGDLSLTEAELARIDKAFPLGPPPPELPML